MPKPFGLSPAFSASGGFTALNHLFQIQISPDVSHTQFDLRFCLPQHPGFVQENEVM